MANVTFSNLGGFIALFLIYIAVFPLLQEATGILVGMAGEGSIIGLLARFIPFGLGLAILTVLYDDEQPVRR